MSLFDFLPSKDAVINSTTNTANSLLNNVVQAGKTALNKTALGSILSPDNARLQSAGLNRGASLNGGLAFTPSAGASADTRVKILYPNTSTIASIVNESPILRPLTSTSGLLFPFQPNISVIHSANYSMQQPAQTNYPYPSYESSMVQSIIIPGEFSASNIDEARYVLAAIHFFRTVTKSYYGQDANAGTPPPVLRLKGGGKHMFDNIPVIITDFNFVLPDDVDYIPVPNNGSSSRINDSGVTMIPTSTMMNITLQPLYSRNQIANDFSLRDFANGKLVSGNGKGGFI